MGACYEHLSYVERLAIDEGRRAGLSSRAIARRLGRAPSTVSRDIKRMGPYRPGYDAPSAFFAALHRRSQSRSGRRKLVAGSPLFDHVAGQLRAGWSPLQIAGRLRRMDPDDRPGTASPGTASPGTVCHETIYTALYALPRGELRRELLSALRQGRQNRRPRSRGADRRRGFVTDDVRIAERPGDVAGRLIPGHWEGDLIKGAANRSAVGTLVERTSRLVLLARMDALDADTTRCAFERVFENVPEPLRKSLTYDRGTEMARHAQLTENTGIKVFFADPYSPWQRASNENANGLIRQYLPKGTDLSPFSQDQLNEVAERLNSRPRKVLDFETPNEVFARLVAEAQATGQQCCASG
ncbi:MAG: IS30 family transposase [Paracoccaceae bacterium]